VTVFLKGLITEIVSMQFGIEFANRSRYKIVLTMVTLKKVANVVIMIKIAFLNKVKEV
jgi:hypothetical protein